MRGAWLRNAMMAATALLSACTSSAAPRPQWLVTLATDAPVPGFGQELLVEVLDPNGGDASLGDSRLFDGSHPSAWPISFGVEPSATGAPPRLRVRFYRIDQVGADGLPVGSAIIDETAVLPALAGITRATMSLRMACFGVLPNLASHLTCNPATKGLAPEPTLESSSDGSALPSPGTWPPARVLPCNAAPPTGMMCIPGGAFLLGASQFAPLSAELDPTPEHVVQLSPFALDVDELTVGTYRTLISTLGATPPLSQEPDDNTPNECTFIDANDATHDALAVNCVDWGQANAACALLGKRLPTEAEWEYAAGNLSLKTPFPWGDDTSVCDYSILGRGRGYALENTACEGAGAPGPVPGGSAMDVTSLGIKNFGGNMSEWTADIFDPYSGPCWTGPSPLVNPLCTSGVAGSAIHSNRGGSWANLPIDAHCYLRDFIDPGGNAPTVLVGFRCAMDL